MNWILFALIAGNIISTSFGALLLKMGAANIKDKFYIKKIHKEILKILKNYKLILGLALYGVSAILFVLSLRIGELSFIYPVTSISYIIISILSIYFLDERMNRYKWIGMFLIAIGVILVSM